MWIYTAPFCAMRFINDARYTNEEMERSKEVEINASSNSYRQNNVTFVDTYRNGNSAPVMQNNGLVRIKTTTNINEGDEIYLCYVEMYNYFNEYGCIVWLSNLMYTNLVDH